METLTIQVMQDHIDRIAKAKKPILGIAELIWNSVDADAKHVTVRLNRSPRSSMIANSSPVFSSFSVSIPSL